MKSFTNKNQIYDYLKNKFIDSEGTIILRGSMVKNKIIKFSDFDFEIYNNKPRDPFYEVVLVNKKPVLITIWFGKYSKKKSTIPPKEIKVVFGDYFSYMSYIIDDKEYKGERKVKRECQSVIDRLFKYLRSNEIENIEKINKKIN